LQIVDNGRGFSQESSYVAAAVATAIRKGLI
jgi:hypothetical protein